MCHPSPENSHECADHLKLPAAKAADDVGCVPRSQLVPAVANRNYRSCFEAFLLLHTQERAEDESSPECQVRRQSEIRDQFETITAQTRSNTGVLHRPEGKTNRHH